MTPKVSIIVPCRVIDRYARECIEKCLYDLDYEKFEVIVLPDIKDGNISNLKDDRLKIIVTGEKTPGEKRNIGIENSTGDIIAFIDSDAYPAKDWLKNAVKYLKNQDVVAVGGPGVTPKEDSTMQKASGYVYASSLMGGLSKRFKQVKNYESDDVHSCNFIVKRSVFNNIKWNEKYWPGEDTLICKDLRKYGRILEAKDVVVYHHRKPLFVPHLRQVYNFGLHRGFFAKRFGGNSLKFVHFLPTFFVLYIFLGSIISMLFEGLRYIFLFSLAIYLLIVAISSLNSKKLFPMVLTGIILTHIIYGLSFILGLIKKDLER